MSIILDEAGSGLAGRIKAERVARTWSLAAMADRSGVSKAMLSKIERGEASPTAVLLVRIAAAFGLTLSGLIARAELGGGQLLRAEDQPKWKDPATGYVRRHLSPPSGVALELIHVELPAGAKVSFPAESYAFIHQLVWLQSGPLHFDEGGTLHEMRPGDCLRLGPPVPCTFHAPGPEPAVYLVAVLSR